MITASACAKREKLFWAIDDLLASLKALGVTVKLKTETSAEQILAMEPYAVVVATGGTPILPRSIRGIELPHVCTAPDVITGKTKVKGKEVVVVGSGMTGLETAELLGKAGNRVTVVEMADELAPGAWFQLVDDEMEHLRQYDVTFLTGKRLMKILLDEIILEDTKTSRLTTLPVDQVVLSLGVRPVSGLAAQLKGSLDRVYVVGDVSSGGTIANAVHNAYETAINIH